MWTVETFLLQGLARHCMLTPCLTEIERYRQQAQPFPSSMQKHREETAWRDAQQVVCQLPLCDRAARN